MYGRPNDYGAMMALGFLSTIDRIEAENPEFAQNIRDFVKISGDHNLLSTDLIADPQSDKSIPRNERPSQLRIVEDRPDGIVISGAKVAGSIGSLAHFFTLSRPLSAVESGRKRPSGRRSRSTPPVSRSSCASRRRR